MNIFEANGELKLDAEEVLYELGNVGTGTAVMAIGNIREMEIRITSPSVVVLKKNILAEIDYDPQQVVVGVSTRMSDTMDGVILFLLSKEFIGNTIYEMTETRYTDEDFMKNEECLSAMKEMINYMTAGYAKVIGSYLNLPVYISTASVGMDNATNIIQQVVEKETDKFEKVACVNTQFTIIDEQGNKTDEVGQVLIFPDKKCIEKFIEIMN